MGETIYVKGIPNEIMKEISKEQAAVKINSGVILNQSKTIIKMLRDYLRCKKLNNFKGE